MADVPNVTQFHDYSCGAACVTAELYLWTGWDGSEKEAMEECGTNETGTEPDTMVACLQSHGLDAEILEDMTLDDLRSGAAAGNSYILMVQAWVDEPVTGPIYWSDRWQDGHYVIYEYMDDQKLYVMDPSTPGRKAFVYVSEFESRWHDYIYDRKAYRAAIRVKGERRYEHVPTEMR